MFLDSFVKENVPLQNQYLQWANFSAVKYF